ncbi:hypothetical protein GDO86_002846 [Hymenochirus boettgeri]|uniref:Anti-proliferative protein domain-containing protein n=1 Tax=Hymenochirus boettgeri TaxID=247094 RepID=A0A8T2K1V6_9PIPI|nr:hypothetical protein GDO86_002846 [Hymenochirus boettgeri]
MKKEIAAALCFLSNLIKNNGMVTKEEVERFSHELTRLLSEKFLNHWYPAKPTKGQAYRCIRVNKFQGPDPDLIKACVNSGLVYEHLALPKEFTLWVDPGEICCRYGERNHAFLVASIESNNDKTEITQKVNSLVDKVVTSDYHSGSSSDDEVYLTSKHAYTDPVITCTNREYQVPGIMQSIPTWSRSNRRKQVSQYNYQPRIATGYPQPARGSKIYGHVPWVPPVLHNDGSHWTGLHLLSASPQCMV